MTNNTDQNQKAFKNYGAYTMAEGILRANMDALRAVMMVSDPGMTKTATVRSIAQEIGYDLVTIIGSRMQPEDVSGFPTRGEIVIEDLHLGTKEIDSFVSSINPHTIKKEKRGDQDVRVIPVTEYAPQSWQVFIQERRKVILFFDEFSNTSPATRASLLSLVQDRQFPNGDFFPDEVIIVGAMNPTESAADGYEMDMATANRFAWLRWIPDNFKWLEGMKTAWGRVTEDSNEGKWRSFIVRFLEENPGLIHKMPDINEASTDGAKAVYEKDLTDPSTRTAAINAWPSYRTWDELARVLDMIDADKDRANFVIDGLTESNVGLEGSVKFREFLTRNGALNVVEIIKNPKSLSDAEWRRLSQNDFQTILNAAVNPEIINKDLYANSIEIFKTLIRIERESFGASQLQAFLGLQNSFKGLTKKEKEFFKRETMEIAKAFSNLTAERQIRMAK